MYFVLQFLWQVYNFSGPLVSLLWKIASETELEKNVC